MSDKIVVKFGGSNLRDSQDYSRLAGIVKSYNQPLVIVVSAYFGLTNKIAAVLEKAVESRKHIELFIDDLYSLKTKLVTENIHSEENRQDTLNQLNERIDKLHQTLNSIHFIGEIPAFLYDQVMSYGEKLNSLLVSAILKDRVLFVRRLFLKTSGFTPMAFLAYPPLILKSQKKQSGKASKATRFLLCRDFTAFQLRAKQRFLAGVAAIIPQHPSPGVSEHNRWTFGRM